MTKPLTLCENGAMSGFVNYNKRDVQLPTGCKDLIDVLNLQGAKPAPEIGFQASVVSTPNFSGELSDIPRHVARLLSSRKVPNALFLVTENHSGVWVFYSTKQGPFELQFAVRCEEVKRLEAAREFFASRGFAKNNEKVGKNSAFAFIWGSFRSS